MRESENALTAKNFADTVPQLIIESCVDMSRGAKFWTTTISVSFLFGSGYSLYYGILTSLGVRSGYDSTFEQIILNVLVSVTGAFPLYFYFSHKEINGGYIELIISDIMKSSATELTAFALFVIIHFIFGLSGMLIIISVENAKTISIPVLLYIFVTAPYAATRLYIFHSR